MGDGRQGYVLKELMPKQDRLHLAHWHGKLKLLEKVIHAMAEPISWQHMRTGGWRGAAIADQCQTFVRDTAWQAPLLDYVQIYNQQVRTDWLQFKAICQAKQ